MSIAWPHQERTQEAIDAAIAAGYRRICITSPTGGGKSYMQRERIVRCRQPSILYCDRKMLLEQHSEGMESAGIEFGVRASGIDPALLRDVQVSSIQTEASRVLRTGKWELHGAKEVHVDEAHKNATGAALELWNRHIESGAVGFLWTATPLGLSHMADHLIVAGTNTELRDCGAHVNCTTFAPDEPDLRKIGKVKVGEDLSERQNRQAIMRPGIFGRVHKHVLRLNPDLKPMLLFGPDVAGSLYFAEEMFRHGIPAAHIDGDEIWMNGERMPSTPEARKELSEASRTGEVKIVCNRFVMREGIDFPWIYHCIFATVFGSLTSYLQAGGRLLRSHSSLDHVILQDHGGNWWRHGSLNADREWSLALTGPIATAMRAERMRERKEIEPIVCPQCGRVRTAGPTCSACGHKCVRQSRHVVQHDGSLKEQEGEIFKPRRIREKADTEAKWIRSYHQALNSKNGMTFNQAYANFFLDHHYYPPKSMPLMPTNDLDWFRKVRDVKKSDLTIKRKGEAA